MKRFAFAVALLSSLAITVAACSDERYRDEPVPYGSTGVACGGYATCGACTPVSGCGWCATAGGGGYCSSDPYTCDQGSATWNWNPQGCRATADAAVVGTRDGGSTSPADGAAADAPSDADAGTSLLGDAASDALR